MRLADNGATRVSEIAEMIRRSNRLEMESFGKKSKRCFCFSSSKSSPSNTMSSPSCKFVKVLFNLVYLGKITRIIYINSKKALLFS